MSAAETIRQVIEAVNRHDTETFTRAYSRDAVVEDPQYTEPLRGQDGVRQDMEVFLRSFPDLQINLRNAIDQGDTVAFEVEMTGTHQGPLPTPDGAEIPPTNKRIEMGMAGFARFDSDGRIVEEHRYYDTGRLVQQLGIEG